MKEALNSQGDLYSLVLKHSNGTWEPRVVGSLVEYLIAPATQRPSSRKWQRSRPGSRR